MQAMFGAHVTVICMLEKQVAPKEKYSRHIAAKINNAMFSAHVMRLVL